LKRLAGSGEGVLWGKAPSPTVCDIDGHEGIPVVNPAMPGSSSLILNKIEHFETASWVLFFLFKVYL
jgi:hypothetical protein